MAVLTAAGRWVRHLSNLYISSQSPVKLKMISKLKKKKVKESFDILFPSVFFIFLSILCLNVIQICFIALSEADQSQEG